MIVVLYFLMIYTSILICFNIFQYYMFSMVLDVIGCYSF